MNKPEYIERKLAIETIQSITAKVLEATDISAPTREIYQLATDHAVGALGIIPVSDVAAVRRGRWIGFPECLKYPNAYSDDHIVCSVCEECFSILDNDAERFDFCPHCGARMEILT